MSNKDLRELRKLADKMPVSYHSHNRDMKYQTGRNLIMKGQTHLSNGEEILAHEAYSGEASYPVNHYKIMKKHFQTGGWTRVYKYVEETVGMHEENEMPRILGGIMTRTYPK